MRLTGLREAFSMLKETSLNWMNDSPFTLSAALSYYTIFSLAPLLVVVTFLVGLIWGGQTEPIQARILAQIRDLIGPEGAGMVRTMLENAGEPGSGGVLATALGVGAMLFGATAVFVQLQNTLNMVWNIEPPGTGVWEYLASRLLSLGLILGIGFLLLVSLLISAGLSAADDFVTGLAPGLPALIRAVNLILSFGVLTILFAMIFRYLPDAEIAWRDVIVGAAITALLFSVGKLGIGLYLGNSGAASTYGAAGSLAVLLLWVYYSAMILFFGAEFTQVYARRHGQRIRPIEE